MRWYCSVTILPADDAATLARLTEAYAESYAADIIVSGTTDDLDEAKRRAFRMLAGGPVEDTQELSG